jgi:hypothetical protein
MSYYIASAKPSYLTVIKYVTKLRLNFLQIVLALTTIQTMFYEVYGRNYDLLEEIPPQNLSETVFLTL